jgi:lipopolysaccharide biosynthesis regulator YciM
MAYYKQVFEQTSNPVLKTVPLNNMAAVAIEEKQYQKAIELLEPVSKQYIDTLPSQKASIIDNLGYAYFKNNQVEQGLNLLQEALARTMGHLW